MAVLYAVTRAAAASPNGMLTANLVLLPSPPPSSELTPNSPEPSMTPMTGWFVM